MAEADFFATGLRKSYGGRQVLGGVSLSLRRGEIVALLGPTGSGKSTCFKILMGIERPDGGRVTLFGRNVTKLGLDGRARLGLGYVPQAPELFERLSVEGNLRIALDTKAGRNERSIAFLDALIDAFGLEEVRHRPTSFLSGGQRRLVEIAYVVCTAPKFLLLDEPFTGLDPIVVDRIVGHIKSLASAGIGVLVTDHKARLTLDLVDRAIVIGSGVVIADGPSAEVARNARVRETFLGEDDHPAS